MIIDSKVALWVIDAERRCGRTDAFDGHHNLLLSDEEWAPNEHVACRSAEACEIKEGTRLDNS